MLPELVCLALAVYYEARSEPFLGQVAVAEVVLNRTESEKYPDGICDVVTQGGTVRHRCQFSYYCDGKPESPQHRHAWRRAVAIAKLAQNGTISADLNEATHYHANYVAPFWRNHYNEVATIGRHIFYASDTRRVQLSSSSDEQSASETLVAANL